MSRADKAATKVLAVMEDLTRPLTKREYQACLEELIADLESRLDAVNSELKREEPEEPEEANVGDTEDEEDEET